MTSSAPLYREVHYPLNKNISRYSGAELDMERPRWRCVNSEIYRFIYTQADSQRGRRTPLHGDSHEIGRLPHGPREEPVEIAVCVPRAILAERRERHEVAALASLAALHARIEVAEGMFDSAP